jgi:hypothetical protein
VPSKKEVQNREKETFISKKQTPNLLSPNGCRHREVGNGEPESRFHRFPDTNCRSPVCFFRNKGKDRRRAAGSTPREGLVLVPHGWPREANCNRLTDAQCREPIMGYPQWKGLLCSIRKA